jgi:predicted ATP-grasp superfamily ATP-dependent carboligase
MNQAVLIISGYNTRAVIAFCRWASANSIKYHIVAKSRTDPIFLTKYKEHVAITRDTAHIDAKLFHSWIQTLSRQYGYDRFLILPSTEFLNRFLLDNRKAAEAENCVIPLVDVGLYASISDKLSFAGLCESHGLDIPKEFSAIPERLPFVAKPRRYLSATGKQLVPHLISSAHELKAFLRDEDTDDYFCQQFVRGRSLYLLAYIRRHGPDVLFSQENLMQQARGGSIVLAKGSDFHQTVVAQCYVKMLHNLGFFGLIMVEVRVDESNGRCFMIEANPRLWGPIQFAVDNHVNLFGAMLDDHGFEIVGPKASTSLSSHYFWSGGITDKSAPVAYHNYSGSQFVEDFPVIRRHDIFFRKDTFSLFLEEAGMRG